MDKKIEKIRRGQIVSINSKGIALVQDSNGQKWLLHRRDHQNIDKSYQGFEWTDTKSSINSYGYVYNHAGKGLCLEIGTEVIFEGENDFAGRLVVSTWEFLISFDHFLAGKSIEAPKYFNEKVPNIFFDHQLCLGIDSSEKAMGHRPSCWKIKTAIVAGKITSVSYAHLVSRGFNPNDGWLFRTVIEEGGISLQQVFQTESARIIFESDYSRASYQVVDGVVEEISVEKIFGSFSPARPMISMIRKKDVGTEKTNGFSTAWYGINPAKKIDYESIRKVRIKSHAIETLIRQKAAEQKMVVSPALEKAFEQGFLLEYSWNGNLTQINCGDSDLKFFQDFFDGKLEPRKSNLPTIYLGQKAEHEFSFLRPIGEGIFYAPLVDVEFISTETMEEPLRGKSAPVVTQQFQVKSEMLARLVKINFNHLKGYGGAVDHVSEKVAEQIANTIKTDGAYLEYQNGKLMKIQVADIKKYERHHYGRFTLNVITARGLENSRFEINENGQSQIFLGNDAEKNLYYIGKGRGRVYTPLDAEVTLITSKKMF